MPRYVGGVEIYTLRLAQALQAEGHTIRILTGEPIKRPDQGITRTEETYEGVPVIRLKYDFLRFPVTSRAAYADPHFTAVIRNVLAEWQPGLVHATSLSLLMGGTIEAANSLDLPLVYTATDYVLTCRRGTYVKADKTICAIKEEPAACTACLGPHTIPERALNRIWQLAPSPLQGPILSWAEKLTGKHADFLQAQASITRRFAYLPRWRQKISHIIAPSTYMRDMLLLNDFPAGKITVLHHGLRPPADISPKKECHVLRFGFIGRITQIKGVHTLLAAWAMLPTELQQQARLTLYGDADDKDRRYFSQIKKQANQLPQVELVGPFDNTVIGQIYQQLDCLVVPSVWPEIGPLTALEALAYQTPVIGSRIGGLSDFIKHGYNGLLFEVNNPQQLAGQLAQCLKSPLQVKRLQNNSNLIYSFTDEVKGLVSIYQLFNATSRSVPVR